jgi:GTP cyclohydrolase II
VLRADASDLVGVDLGEIRHDVARTRQAEGANGFAMTGPGNTLSVSIAGPPIPNGTPRAIARVVLPTPYGEFDTHAFECDRGFVYLAMARGVVTGADDVLTRIHSECLTGDSLGSLRCDCGPQLRASLRAIAAEGRGLLVYVTGHEGRGIGLVEKLRAYMIQEDGADTVEANELLGLPVDARDFHAAARILRALDVRSVRLLTNNPSKVDALRAGGVSVSDVIPLQTAAHARNLRYMRTKRDRLHHVPPSGPELNGSIRPVVDVSSLLGEVRERVTRPYVVVKFAQTLDGRIATASGDSKWISGEEERRLSHALRSACDAVLVGVQTVLSDDPQLTVRMVEGPSPTRIVLDSALRIPDSARVLEDEAQTIVVTTERAPAARRFELRRRGVGVLVVAAGRSGVNEVAALRALREAGIRSLLVEGGAAVITSFLSAGLADRLVVGLAPTVIGAGLGSVGDMNVLRVRDGLRLENREVRLAGDDVVIAGDLVTPSVSELTTAEAGDARS